MLTTISTLTTATFTESTNSSPEITAVFPVERVRNDNAERAGGWPVLPNEKECGQRYEWLFCHLNIEIV
ncbi:hypothetical protein ACS86_03375 [Vibrio alginolyticus]|nr:hypothetical protein ACS86_03375 [Vibrio alginolyticus]